MAGQDEKDALLVETRQPGMLCWAGEDFKRYSIMRLEAVEKRLALLDTNLKTLETYRVQAVERDLDTLRQGLERQSRSFDRLADAVASTNDLVISTNQAVTTFVHDARQDRIKLLAGVITGVMTLALTGVGFVWGIWQMVGNPF